LTLDPGATARLPVWIAGAVVLAAGLAFAFRAFRLEPMGGRSDRNPVFAILAVYGGGLVLAGGLLYPTLVPPSVTVHEAASPHTTLLFITIAMTVVVPFILAYQAYGKWVFRGKLGATQEGVA
jgi:cytochrome d ubiquinol oxidase subunit II